MSLIEALSRATDRARVVCFSPFDAAKWLVFGIVAFLATCGEGGTPPYSGGGGDGGEAPTAGAAREALRFLADNGALLVAIGLFVLLVVAAVLVVITWVTSRAKIFWVEAIATNRFESHDVLARHAREGHSLFLLRLAVGAVFFLLMAVLVASAFVPILQLLAGGMRAVEGVGLLIGAGLGVLLVWVIAVVVGVVIDDLLVPTLYLRRGTVKDAWAALRPVLSARPGEVIAYVVVRLLVGVAVGAVLVALGCLTCCLGFLPVVGHVLFLPVHVFVRSISLHWLEQLGSEWSVFHDPRAPETTPEGTASGW